MPTDFTLLARRRRFSNYYLECRTGFCILSCHRRGSFKPFQLIFDVIVDTLRQFLTAVIVLVWIICFTRTLRGAYTGELFPKPGVCEFRPENGTKV
jgi:hypothetical protein